MASGRDTGEPPHSMGCGRGDQKRPEGGHEELEEFCAESLVNVFKFRFSWKETKPRIHSGELWSESPAGAPSAGPHADRGPGTPRAPSYCRVQR